MRIYAEKIINDALFETQLGTLNRYAFINIPSIPENQAPKVINNSINEKVIEISAASSPLDLHDGEQSVENIYQTLQPTQSHFFSISNLLEEHPSNKNGQETPDNDMGDFFSQFK